METKDKETTPTGYPSIDKPWLKYYLKEVIDLPRTARGKIDYRAVEQMLISK